ncbi:hypothetical protein K504DRAFT_428750 [Pleomassaria siparia CBS 279.74]|uniref:Zn(2)-C6 fungal-type domain-containing protein n=1 Tax=Pleomassaria siparia CBS 279.74 TaxID=1314801 RepID=A0A6G1KG46_9PLEO|nr:hypothetical protein K504DRAFT_428750 [Pleomassaria siparia CBS 279.74]
MSLPIEQPAFLAFCPTCNKASTKETSHHRHISYCRRAQTKNKGRPQSCAACSRAKVKCSFTQPQCIRCASRGLSCVYKQPRRLLSTAMSSPIEEGRNDQSQSLAPQTPLSLDMQSTALHNATSIPPNDNFEDATFLFDTEDFFQDVSSASFGQNMFSGVPMSHPPSSPAPTSFPLDDVACGLGDMREQSRTELARIEHQKVSLDYRSDLIIYIIKRADFSPLAFPKMMLRRQTFPPFIHPYWHWPVLPEKLASCMSIAQLFEARNPDTAPFLWRVIDAEAQRFRDEIETMDVYHIQWACQALMIYIIMIVVDHDGDHRERGNALLRLLQASIMHGRRGGGACQLVTN